ncbi:MAG TPA: hypothetical protein P5277_03845 [Candidatus Paceibacterota bacterium]|nr:hypothetical protein [Candidatus Paceibacterota bacterium]
MSKIIGYVLSVLGILLLILALNPIRQSSFISDILPIANIPNYVFIGLGVVCMAIAFIFMKQSGSKQAPEVPIFEGKNVVGFRRMKKKR